jgi:hypothetical protein
MDMGYDWVSTQDQHPTLQLDALHAAGIAISVRGLEPS